MKAFIAVLIAALCFEGLNAQCPEPDALQDASGNKLCAQMFQHSSYYYDQSCQGKVLDVYPGEDYPILTWEWDNRISSLVVAKSCSLTVWSRSKKQGSKKTFSAGIAYHLKDVKDGLFGDWNDSISGYYCICRV
ncbi:syncollin-like [Triplophysa dalaica]|uniref:syncollin-like n=1 Tax=Triplophysa dalaica TaxID=1582913 RepID=UPI0024DFDA2C|nr:syncollin-like [Triplophysa dalaica]